MRISKLFHWLYAILMFLPIFAIGAKVGYVVFNKNAYQSYSGSYSYEQTLKLSDSASNFLDYTNWQVSSSNNLHYYTDETYFSFFQIQNMPLRRGSSQIYINISYEQSSFVGLNVPSDTKSIAIFLNSNLTYTGIRFSPYYVTLSNIPTYSNTILTETLNNALIYTTDNTLYTTNNDWSNMTNSFNYMYSYVYVTDTTLSSVFYSALQELQTSEFFAWSYPSFLVEPFIYITSLFGMSPTNPILNLFSYWLSISIIWLTFDLIMYLPLLIHRWLDKGVIE